MLPENMASPKYTHISAPIMLSPESSSLEIAHGEFLFAWILYVPHPIPAFVKTLFPEWPISPLPDTDISAIRLPSVTGKEILPTPPLQILSEENLCLIPPYHHQHHLRHTLHPRRQHYAVLDVLSLVWEYVVSRCCFLMECRQ